MKFNNYFFKTSVVIAAFSSSLFLSSCDDDDDDVVEEIVGEAQEDIEVTISFEASGPLAFAPVLFTTHSGNVDVFDTGSEATAELEVMAEVGDLEPLIGTLSDGVDASHSEAPTAPGASFEVSHTISAGNPYFSYVGMALPTSDTFIGNNNPLQFDIAALLEAAAGQPVVLEVTRMYDAGTEVNDFLTSPGGPLVGAPAGVPTDGVEENGVITLVTGNPFLNYANPGDFDVSTIDPEGEVVATITITPVAQ